MLNENWYFNCVYSFIRWKNYIIRGIFTLIMILGFCLIIYGGPLALMITVIFIRLVVSPPADWFYFPDAFGASEMLWGDYLHWISGVSYSWFAVVPKLVVVLFAHVQLLFLRWKLGGLLRCGHQPRRVPPFPCHLSSILIVHPLLHWVRLVCLVTRQEVLHEAIQLVRLDSCRPLNCRDSELFNHPKHIRR